MTIQGLSLLGVNLSGAEYGNPTAAAPGRLYTNYILPSVAELDYYAGRGLNVIRLPFSWERMQGTLNGPLNGTYLEEISQVVSQANARGLAVVLDLHNYGKYHGQAVGTAAVPAASLVDLWSRVAARFAGSNVLFGLMNEPGSQTPSVWAPIAASLVTAIRAAGATTQEILVPGGVGDGASSFVSSGNAAALSAAIRDPSNNFAYEVHQYLDRNESGTSTAVVSPTIGVERLTAVTSWAEATGARLFLGEFAAGPDAASLDALSNMMAFMARHNGAWQGGTYWAGGQWWGSYPFSIEPVAGVDKPQMAVLTRFEGREVVPEPARSILPGFDVTYYLAHNPDVAAARVDPTQHFLVSGWHENRNPSGVFDTRFYLTQNRDVAAAGLNPLLHYLAFGATEGRAPSLVFDGARYLSFHPDVAAARMDPLLHYVSYGQHEGRATFLSGGRAAADPLVDPAYFDAQLGASLLPTGAAAAEQATSAFRNGGWQAGLNPSAWFDVARYLARNPDVAAAHVEPLTHYAVSGWHEGRTPSAAFNSNAYLATYADVRNAGVEPLLHYLVSGRNEGRVITTA